ncbi:MAG: hypothetical protein JXR70_11195 [Spirochaetales bacterium]|nr:hypothetical protein [Spirochaetales bacterium]
MVNSLGFLLFNIRKLAYLQKKTGCIRQFEASEIVEKTRKGKVVNKFFENFTLCRGKYLLAIQDMAA